MFFLKCVFACVSVAVAFVFFLTVLRRGGGLGWGTAGLPCSDFSVFVVDIFLSLFIFLPFHLLRSKMICIFHIENGQLYVYWK